MDLRRFEPPRWVALALLAVTSICVWVPLHPVMPGVALDEAWAVGLNEAVARGLVFGEDLIFTFGPYSFVFSKMYHPGTDTLMLVSSLYLAMTYWVALVLLTRDSKRHLAWTLLLLLAGFMNARDTLLLSYPLVVGLVCVRRTGEPQGPANQPYELTALLALVTSSFGLLPLIKGSMLALCGLVVPIAFVMFALERRWRLAAAVAISPLVSLALWWIAIGQPLGGLPQHFRALLPIISGYAGAMGFPGALEEIAVFLVAALSLLAAVMLDRTTPWRQRIALLCVFGAFYFVALKAGFVRHDSHALICGLAVLFAALVFCGTVRSRMWPVVLVFAVACWGFINQRHYHLGPRVVVNHVVETFATPLHGIARRLSGGGLHEHYVNTMNWIGTHSGFPRLDGTSDIYSFNQTSLIASGNHWNPRPILQSYSVYMPYLDEQNRAHLRGPGAPDNIFFRLEPIDFRLPSLDDGGSWPLLWTHYLPVRFAGDTLILKRRPQPAASELTTLARVSARLGKAIKVPQAAGAVVAEIDLRPGVLGRLLSLAYKPSPLLIELNMVAGGTRMYRYSANMGQLGIVVSPLIESTREFATMSGGVAYLDSKQVASFRIVPDGAKWPWQRKFTVTFKTLALEPAIDPRQFLTLAPRVSGPPAQLEEGACEGVLDVVNELSPVPHEIAARGLLTVRGWLAVSTQPAVVAAERYLVLRAASGEHHIYTLEATERPDVGAYFKNPALNQTGYAGTVDIADMAGTFTLGLAFRDGDRIRRCSKWNHVVQIESVLAPEDRGR